MRGLWAHKQGGGGGGRGAIVGGGAAATANSLTGRAYSKGCHWKLHKNGSLHRFKLFQLFLQYLVLLCETFATLFQ